MDKQNLEKNMVFKESLLKVADNSGAKILKCIQVVGGSVAREGDFIIVSVKKARPGKKVQKGKVYKAVVVQCRKCLVRRFGQVVGFRSNRAVLLKKSESRKADFTPLGTRVSKFVSFRLREQGLLKFLLISPGQL